MTQCERFCGAAVTYVVDVQGTAGLAREHVWLRSVGRLLRSTPTKLLSEYQTAGVGTRKDAKTLLREVKRTFAARDGKVKFSVSQEAHAAPPAPPQRRSDRPNLKRKYCREFCREIEHHWENIFVLFGTLFNSTRDFRAANMLLSRESASNRDLQSHGRRQCLRHCSGVNYPRFYNLRNWTSYLKAWAAKRIFMGTLVCTPSLVVDKLVDVVQQEIDTCSAVSGTANQIHIDLLLWVDGTSSGIRAVTVTKFRLVDCCRLLFPSGVSRVTCWMEAFCDETAIPLEFRMLMLEELNHLWSTTLVAGSTPVVMRYLLLCADHKQLNYLCGVQGFSTSQRCSFCTVPAHLFVANCFAGKPRSFQQTTLDAMACAEEILVQPSETANLRRKYNNVSDVPFVMLGECQIPMPNVIVVPPCMHNNRGILDYTFEWLWNHISYPAGSRQTLTIAREILLARLTAQPHLHCKFKRWNNTSYQIAFSVCADLFEGLLDSVTAHVPFMASVISYILNSPSATPTPKRRATLLTYTFLLPLMMRWETSNLYWHSVMHLIPVLERLQIPACLVSEENFEGAFRPVKKVLRGRSNNHVGDDLLVVRAFGESSAVIRDEWAPKEVRGERGWCTSISVDVVVAPCLMKDLKFLSNLPGLLEHLLHCDPSSVSTVRMTDQKCLRIACGDVPELAVICACGKHAAASVGVPASGYSVDLGAVESARNTLESTFVDCRGKEDEVPVEWRSTDDEHDDSEAPPSTSSSSEWAPRSYYASQDDEDGDEPIAKRLRPVELGEFFSEHYFGVGDPEYNFSDD